MKAVIFTFAAMTLFGNLKAQDASSLSRQVSFDSVATNTTTTGNFKRGLFIGFEIGYDKNYLLTDISSLAFTTVKPLNGYVIGFPLEYQLNSWMSISSNLNFAQKNYQIARSGFFQGVYENFTNSYIQLPLFAHFTFGRDKISGFLNVGGYGAYWMASRIKGTLPNILNPVNNSSSSSVLGTNKAYSYDEKYEFNSTKDNRWELGWLLGIGVNYYMTSQCKLFAEARLTESFTDQQKNYMNSQTPRYNKTYGFSIGCMIRLKLFKGE